MGGERGRRIRDLSYILTSFVGLQASMSAWIIEMKLCGDTYNRNGSSEKGSEREQGLELHDGDGNTGWDEEQRGRKDSNQKLKYGASWRSRQPCIRKNL